MLVGVRQKNSLTGVGNLYSGFTPDTYMKILRLDIGGAFLQLKISGLGLISN